MHELRGVGDCGSEGFAYGLLSQANAKYGYLAFYGGFQDFHHSLEICGSAGSGAYDDGGVVF